MANAQGSIDNATGSRAAGFRQQVLQAARRFKSTWFELGRLLVRVRNEALHEPWGYDSFESYCAKELHIRKRTALKLTRSYSFLDKHEPGKVNEDLSARAPAFEVVEVLAEAEERGQLSSAEYKAVRDSIWDPDRPTTELKRELASRFPRPASDPTHTLRRLAQSAGRLANELKTLPRIPRTICDHALALAEELQALALREEKR